MKKIQLRPDVPDEVRAIPQHIAMTILDAIHRYAKTGVGRSPATWRACFVSASAIIASSSRRPPRPSSSHHVLDRRDAYR